MGLFPFPASVLSVVSITMELNGRTWQFAHAQRRETLPLKGLCHDKGHVWAWLTTTQFSTNRNLHTTPARWDIYRAMYLGNKMAKHKAVFPQTPWEKNVRKLDEIVSGKNLNHLWNFQAFFSMEFFTCHAVASSVLQLNVRDDPGKM